MAAVHRVCAVVLVLCATLAIEQVCADPHVSGHDKSPTHSAHHSGSSTHTHTHTKDSGARFEKEYYPLSAIHTSNPAPEAPQTYQLPKKLMLELKKHSHAHKLTKGTDATECQFYEPRWNPVQVYINHPETLIIDLEHVQYSSVFMFPLQCQDPRFRVGPVGDSDAEMVSGSEFNIWTLFNQFRYPDFEGIIHAYTLTPQPVNAFFGITLDPFFTQDHRLAAVQPIIHAHLANGLQFSYVDAVPEDVIQLKGVCSTGYCTVVAFCTPEDLVLHPIAGCFGVEPYNQQNHSQYVAQWLREQNSQNAQPQLAHTHTHTQPRDQQLEQLLQPYEADVLAEEYM